MKNEIKKTTHVEHIGASASYFMEPYAVSEALWPLFKTVERKIRYGLYPDRPCLLSQWFKMTLGYPAMGRVYMRHNLYYQYHLLLEVIADETVPKHWRRSCLNQITRPIDQIARLCDCAANRRNVAMLYAELKSTAAYSGL